MANANGVLEDGEVEIGGLPKGSLLGGSLGVFQVWPRALGLPAASTCGRLQGSLVKIRWEGRRQGTCCMFPLALVPLA